MKQASSRNDKNKSKVHEGQRCTKKTGVKNTSSKVEYRLRKKKNSPKEKKKKAPELIFLSSYHALELEV